MIPTVNPALFHFRRSVLSYAVEGAIKLYATYSRLTSREVKPVVSNNQIPENPQTPEDFRPLENACFQNPYDFYRMLRSDYPVYQLENGIYCISRYQDIVDICRNTDVFSSTHQGLMNRVKPGQDITDLIAKVEKFERLGLIPCSVLGVTDPPEHTEDRKVARKGFNVRYIKSLEQDVEVLCREMMDEFIDRGEVEFMQDFCWRLPMLIIMRLLGVPDEDLPKIKKWCQQSISLLGGVATDLEMIEGRGSSLRFIRYCWRHYLIAKRNPQRNLLGMLATAAGDDTTSMSDSKAVSTMVQLLIAGSDSSASSMGNALKMLVENPGLEQELRQDNDKIPAFVEEVFRLETAFQGHFRWVKEDTELHGVKLAKGSRVFLIWASGNRDEDFWDKPDEIKLNRPDSKRHLTFGHGIHACIGNELARIEIRTVIKALLQRTENIRLTGDAPFVASMMSRSLVRLPIAFDRVAEKQQAQHKEERLLDTVE